MIKAKTIKHSKSRLNHLPFISFYQSVSEIQVTNFNIGVPNVV